MCRIFGFRSVLRSHVHRSLTSAENALAVQSERHPDGWGVAYYVAQAPHIIKSAGSAMEDKLFQRVSGIVTSETVLAHIRKATRGERNTLNSHPFQHGRWVMAHNGDVPDFADRRAELLAASSPRLRGFVLGDTDSELIFHLLLSELAAEVELDRRGTPMQAVVGALRRTVELVQAVVAAAGGADPPLLTMVVTDGEIMAGYQGGKELFFSTHKTTCPERDRCPYLARECEAPPQGAGNVNHLILSSEPLQGDNVWVEMGPGEIVAVDHFMRFVRFGADGGVASG